MIGLFGVISAVFVAFVLLGRAARAAKPAAGDRVLSLLKFAAFLGLCGVLFAARLWPLALMVIIAAGGVTAIETWRERKIAAEPSAASPAPVRAGAMSVDEARSVLGLSADATPDAVRAAHRRLISQMHPDHGGSNYLAAKINEARDVLERALSV